MKTPRGLLDTVSSNHKICRQLRALARPSRQKIIEERIEKAGGSSQELIDYLTVLSNYSGRMFWRSQAAKTGQAFASSVLSKVEKDNEDLSAEETAIIKNRVLDRQTGNKVILRGFGLEQYLSMFFRKDHIYDENPISDDLLANFIQGKRVLVVPGYGPNAFLFKMLGAKEVVGVDADPVTIAWLKAVKKYFYYGDVGNYILSTAEYPNEDAMERFYLSCRDLVAHVTGVIQHGVNEGEAGLPLKGVKFARAFLGISDDQKERPSISSVLAKEEGFDFIYVPYLLGIKNGIEDRASVKKALDDLWALANPGARVMIAPFSGSEQGICEIFGCRQDPEIINDLNKLVPQDKFRFVDDVPLGGTNAQILEVIK